MIGDDLPCAHVVELLSDYLERASDPVPTASVDAHLSADSDATSVIAARLRTVHHLPGTTPHHHHRTGTRPEPTLPSEAVNAMEEAFRDLLPRHVR